VAVKCCKTHNLNETLHQISEHNLFLKPYPLIIHTSVSLLLHNCHLFHIRFNCCTSGISDNDKRQ